MAVTGRRSIGRVALVAAVALTAAGCGVPSDKQYTAIQRDDIPFNIADTTTTSTTTTTIPPATTIAPITTTTVPAKVVALYFITTSGQLAAVPRLLPLPAPPDQVLVALQKGPDEKDLPVGLRGAVPPGTVLGVSVVGGIATVDLLPAFLQPPTGTETPPVATVDYRLAFGQLVLTLTSQPGIGQVRFTSAGQPQPAILPDGSSEVQPVSADSYASLRSAG